MHQYKIESGCRSATREEKKEYFADLGKKNYLLAMKRDYFIEVAFELVAKEGTEFLYFLM